ncbi:PREDICTED: uncharacterized protein LOC103341520 [Prunus mume]|uniref:Uncharacterized protein LOC103341520 n=1 Tax=Prunus mume TaxID=102107 RepID=A0ABM0PRA1_PRUMU|nr:PREDICTED: uncharacterized protein LOC103341520 [Prunus mume]
MHCPSKNIKRHPRKLTTHIHLGIVTLFIPYQSSWPLALISLPLNQVLLTVHPNNISECVAFVPCALATWRLPITLHYMTHQVPDWATTTTTEEGDSSKSFQYEDFGPLPDSVVPHHHPHPQTETDHDYSVWNINTSGASGATGAAEDHNPKCFQEIFEDLSNIQLEPTITPNAIFSSDKHLVCDFDKGESSSGLKTTSRFMETKTVSGEIRQKQDDRPKRTRAAELHNMSERKRRKKIRGKLGALQQLIPNCNTSDRASMLDDAIKHIKALKLQIQMMSMGGGALYQASNLSMAGMQSTQTPQFMSYVPMGTSNAYGMGMGMVNMCYSTTGLPIMCVPSARFNPLQPATAGFPLMSAPGVLPVNPQLQMPMPFVASQVMPTATTTSRSRNMGQPQFATDFSHTFNYANQGESSFQNNTNNAASADNQRVPIISKKSKVLASHVVTPPSSVSDK